MFQSLGFHKSFVLEIFIFFKRSNRKDKDNFFNPRKANCDFLPTTKLLFIFQHKLKYQITIIFKHQRDALKHRKFIYFVLKIF